MSLLTRTQPRRSFNGQTESIARQPYIDLPANSVGENYPPFQEDRSATFARFESFVPTQSNPVAGQSSDIPVTSPQYMVVAVGW
jgi:hypothetical protein